MNASIKQWKMRCVSSLLCGLLIGNGSGFAASHADDTRVAKPSQGPELNRLGAPVSESELLPAAAAQPSFVTSPSLLNLDVDGNGSSDALTDGLLVIRYLFGFRGAALVDGAVGTGCTRCGDSEVAAYLRSLSEQGRYASCRGFAGLRCSGDLVCTDYPWDSCDPNNGGFDCSGICVDPGALETCGFFAGGPCSSGTCVDDPRDWCDPSNGGFDCAGVCVDP